jgi:metal-dependent amidase/aminoacylase/carboxypeptidase family protein
MINVKPTNSSNSPPPLQFRRFALILASSVILCCAGCHHFASQPSASAIQSDTDRIFKKLVDIRRDIHQNPELAGQESRTSAKVALHLRELGLDVQTGEYGHSVVAILRGKQPGKTVVWRAELDALPGDYIDLQPFKSTAPGIHHACGHDIHIAIALGIAENLAKHRNALHGKVVFIFQPEEETFVGAKALIEQGVFSLDTPDEIYGAHVTVFPVGQIVVRANEMFAHQRRIRISFRDEISIDATSQLTKSVHSALTRTKPGARPWEIQNIADPIIGILTENTAFQDYLIMDESFDTHLENGDFFLEADLYETNAANLGSIIDRIKRAVVASGLARELLGVSFVQANPTVLNNETLTRDAVATLQQLKDTRVVVKLSFGQAPFFNDDFAYFQQKIPGVLFFLGATNTAKGLIAMNHAPNFQADEESIRVGVNSFSALIFARLAKAE